MNLRINACMLAVAAAALVHAPRLGGGDVLHMSDGQKSLEFVEVGDAGNQPDTRPRQHNSISTSPGTSEWRQDGSGPCGAVAYVYGMGKYDVTMAQYAVFLNAVARTDSYGLWETRMGREINALSEEMGSITRIGGPGNYRYTVRPGRENFPVVYVNWIAAARLANWMTNGQPDTGSEEDGTTESGSYDLHGIRSGAQINAIKRNPDAVYVIPNVDEWYKAAYYKGHGLNAGYWGYPTCSDTVPSHELSTGTNNANFFDKTFTDEQNHLTEVGAFSGSPGPYGTFDQGGDVWQWNEATFNLDARGIRGNGFARYGSSGYGGDPMFAGYFDYWKPATSTDDTIGIRLAMIPKPGQSIPIADPADPVAAPLTQLLPLAPAIPDRPPANAGRTPARAARANPTPARGSPPSPSVRPSPTVESSPEIAQSIPDAPPAKSRTNWMIPVIGLGALLLILAVLAGVLVLRRSRGTPEMSVPVPVPPPAPARPRAQAPLRAPGQPRPPGAQARPTGQPRPPSQPRPPVKPPRRPPPP